jgi:hypothetical protein
MPRLSATRLTLTLLALAAAAAPAAHAQYSIPADNPLVGNPLARHEIYVYGLRNPFRWSFDRLNGDMWIGDVGGIQEEVDHLPAGNIAGANLGWHCLSGTAVQEPCLPGGRYVGPVHTYPSGPDVVIGGYVVRDPDLSAFTGRYLFARLNSGIYRLEPNGSATQVSNVSGVAGFGEDGVGHLYAASLNGPVYRLGQSGSGLTTTSIGNFTQPLGVAAAPGDTQRLFVVQQGGLVRLRSGGQVTTFLDLTSLVRTSGGEEGLLAFAVSPDYATSGRVFAYYVNQAGDLQLDEYRRVAGSPDRSEVGTRRAILTIPHPVEDNHNGGQLLFDRNGLLYLSTGDGGGQGDTNNDAQSQASLLGKILRIDVGIPPSALDRVAPRLRAKAKARQRLLRLRGAIAYARCDENCSILAGGRLHVGKRVLKLRRVQKLQPANKRARLRVRLGTKARRAIVRGLRRHRGVRVEVTLRARDATGNRSRLLRKNVRPRR